MKDLFFPVLISKLMSWVVLQKFMLFSIALSLRCWHLIPIGEFLLKLICNLHLDLSLRFFTTRFCVESRIFYWIVDFNHSNLSNRYAEHENSDEFSWKSKAQVAFNSLEYGSSFLLSVSECMRVCVPSRALSDI